MKPIKLSPNWLQVKLKSDEYIKDLVLKITKEDLRELGVIKE
jgi:hypothetical protein